MRERERDSQSQVGWFFFYEIINFHNFFLKYDMGAIWLLMHKTSRAIWVDKIDSTQSAQISYYFVY